jgi:hypothetical protein
VSCAAAIGEHMNPAGTGERSKTTQVRHETAFIFRVLFGLFSRANVASLVLAEPPRLTMVRLDPATAVPPCGLGPSSPPTGSVPAGSLILCANRDRARVQLSRAAVEHHSEG